MEPPSASVNTTAQATTLWTIGHSTLPLKTFVQRLHEAGVRAIADVRRFPASRRHPQFERHAMAAGLDSCGLAYRWFEALGGRRSRVAGDERNAALRVGAFRAYADYALTAPFHEALGELLTWARDVPVAVCCAEGLWWQCHRRIIADHLVARGHRVVHLLPAGKHADHELWGLAVVTPQGVTYPPPQAPLFDAPSSGPPRERPRPRR